MQNNKTYREIDELNNHSWDIRYSNPSEALTIALEALNLSERNNYEKGRANALLNKATVSFLLSNGDEATLSNLNEALHYFEKQNDDTGIARALNYMGNVYDGFGEYDKALACCLRAVKVAEATKQKSEMGDILSTTGNIYSRLADYEQALASYRKSLSIREEIRELRAAASSMNLIARAYTLKNDYENGLAYYQKSLKLREEQNDPALPWTYLGLASLYEKKNDSTKALEYYAKCRDLNKHNEQRLELHCLIGLGKGSEKEKALDYLNQALAIATAINAKPLQYEVHELLAKVYESQKDTTKAFEHFKLFHSLREEVLNAESANKLKKQQISFAVERAEKEAEIERIRNVELKAAYDIIEEKNKDITSSINYALRIQKAMLPNLDEVQKNLPQSFILFKPKDIVSGDFYWAAPPPPEGRINTVLQAGLTLIAAADCTGHGVPGALMSMLGNEKLNDAVKRTTDVSEILSIVNKEVKKALKQQGKEEDTKDGMDIALCAIQASPPSEGGSQENFGYEMANPILYGRLKDFAKEHRSVPTDAENSFWQLVRAKSLEGYKFRRQHIIGDYIADFVCLPHRLIIEIDGLIHELPENKISDEQRTSYLKSKGFRVLRFKNNEVIGNPEAILKIVLNELQKSTRQIPPSGGGGALISYSAANRPLWIIKKGATEIEEIKATKTAIAGYTDDNQVFEKHSFHLKTGDTFYIFSDGFGDQFGGEHGKKLTTKRFKDLLLGMQDKSMQEQKQILENAFLDWKGSTEQTDDVLVIGVRV